MIKSPRRFGRGKECGERRVENVKSEKRGVLICRLSICQSFLDQKRRSCKMGGLADRGGGRSKVVGLDSVSQEQLLLRVAKRLKKKGKKTHHPTFFWEQVRGFD